MNAILAIAVALFGLLPAVAAAAVLVAGIQRLRGRRSRALDGVADVARAAFARSIYPPSLRGGGPDVPVPRSRPILRRRRRGTPVP